MKKNFFQIIETSFTHSENIQFFIGIYYGCKIINLKKKIYTILEKRDSDIYLFKVAVTEGLLKCR